MADQVNYKRTLAGSVGAGVGAIFSASGRTYYILEHKTTTGYHNAGDSDKIIVDQVELGRDSSCQVRFDESCETVSRKHAAIVREGDGWKIIPLSQTNATYVNSVPVQGERKLNSGDEIRLSSHGPVMGFIVPQGASSLVKSIGMTERMNLFRKQALAPYKKGLTILTVLLAIVIIGAVVAGVLGGQKIVEQGNVIAEQGKNLAVLEDQRAELEKGLLNQRDELDKQYEKIMEQEDYVNDLQKQIEEKEAERLAAEQAMAEASAAERAALQAQIDAANEAAEAAKKNAAAAASQLRQYKKAADEQSAAIKDLEKQIKETETAIVKAEVAPAAPAAEKAAAVAEKAAAPAENALFSNIEDCYSAVYYIQMDNVQVYDRSGTLKYQFDMTDFVGGTGFMLDDGTFVTARRVVEPWFYYTSTSIGKDEYGQHWTLGYLQYLTYYGWKIDANFTAYSPAKTSFKFRTSEMSTREITSKTKVTDVVPAKHIRKLVKSNARDLFVYDDSKNDWATLGKSEQLASVKGLKSAPAASATLNSGDAVIALCYPYNEGFKNSLKVNPELRKNTVNSPDLNNVGVIELATKRYYKGADGAPVLVQIDGVWTVVGILGHTDLESDRDFAAPIKNIEN